VHPVQPLAMPMPIKTHSKTERERVRFDVPPNTLLVISGTGFYGSNDPTNSVKALKEDRF